MFSPTSVGDLAERKAERNDVVARGRHARHHHAFADAHELMDRDVAAEKRVIADANVTAEHHVVGKRHVVADVAIMPDMGSDHEEAAIADAGHAAAVLGPGIHGDALAQLAARPDHQPRRAAAIVHRLRRRAQRGERIDDACLRRSW